MSFGTFGPELYVTMSSVRFSFPRLVLICLLGSAALSCSSAFQLNADDQASLQQAMDTPLEFVVSRDHAIDSWDRALDFVNRYSTMKLRNTTDSLITTYEEPTVTPTIESAAGIRYGYSVNRFRDIEGIRYRVRCTPSVKIGEKDADQNAHLAAQFIKTGTVCDRCIVR